MSNGQAVIDGVKYLADTFCEGKASEVKVTGSESTGYLRLYLAAEERKVFSDSEVKAMEALGFYYTPFDEEEYEEGGVSFFEWITG